MKTLRRDQVITLVCLEWDLPIELEEMIQKFSVIEFHKDIIAKDWKPKLITKEYMREKKEMTRGEGWGLEFYRSDLPHQRPFLWEIQHKDPYDLQVQMTHSKCHWKSHPSNYHQDGWMGNEFKSLIKRGFKGKCVDMVWGNLQLMIDQRNVVLTKDGNCVVHKRGGMGMKFINGGPSYNWER
jgi:hypothetical protein